jgi:hypothetical protein
MFHLLRKRTPSAPVIGANLRIRAGEFGEGSVTAYDLFGVDARCGCGGLYNYHQGNVFFPGTGNFVFEPNFELPLQTVWGFGFIRNPNTFKVQQPPQVWSQPHVQTNGIGGLQAGEIEFQPLIEG